MAERIERPKQLHLELQLGYLKKINSFCEKPDFYESMSQALLRDYNDLPKPYPLWNEINRLR
jgi:hypothetical protein